jgi:hypothetical protein
MDRQWKRIEEVNHRIDEAHTQAHAWLDAFRDPRLFAESRGELEFELSSD